MGTNMKLAENIKKKANKLVGYAIWILIFLLVLSLIRNAGNAGRISSEIAAEQAKVAKMQSDNQALEAEIAKTQGQEFIEKEIRNKLGLVKPGEAIVVLPDDETLRKLAPEVVQDQESLPDPNWKRWLKLFI